MSFKDKYKKFKSHRTFRTSRTLEDLTEEEILRLEEIYGAPIRRPSEEERSEWRKAREELGIKGKWNLSAPKGYRKDQTPLEKLWKKPHE